MDVADLQLNFIIIFSWLFFHYIFLPTRTPLGTSGFRNHMHAERTEALAEAHSRPGARLPWPSPCTERAVSQGTRHRNLLIASVLLSARLRPLTRYGSVILEETVVAQLNR